MIVVLDQFLQKQDSDEVMQNQRSTGVFHVMFFLCETTPFQQLARKLQRRLRETERQ